MTEGASSLAVPIGGLDAPASATVDAVGTVRPRDAGWELAWSVGADDGWRDPDERESGRQRLLDAAPVVETLCRVPRGDARHRAFGLGGPGGVVVVEVENDSPGAFVLALEVRPTSTGRVRRLAVEGRHLVVDGRVGAVLPGVPHRWAVDDGTGSARREIRDGAAGAGPFPAVRRRRGDASAILLFPVAHQATARVALARAPGALAALEPRALPSARDAARGWVAALDRGLRVEPPDAGLARGIDAARAQALLLGRPESRPTPALVATLEDWGFDEEAAAAWNRLSVRGRRAAARRDPVRDPWAAVRAAQAAASPVWTWTEGPATLLGAVRALVAREREPGGVELVPAWPAEWLGQSLTVHDLPSRSGPVSFGVRWHGERPALLWSAPAGLALRAPGLDPGWVTEEPEGEALLAAPTTRLLDLRTASADAGERVDDPGDFS